MIVPVLHHSYCWPCSQSPPGTRLGYCQNNSCGRAEDREHAIFQPVLYARASCLMLEIKELRYHRETTCAVHIEDCEGWWLSGCHSSVADHWRLKPGVLGSTPEATGLFTFLYFHLITSKFPYCFV